MTKLANEAIHLASGFQVARYGHVVGSMWTSNEDVCAEVPEEFYTQLKSSSVFVLGDYKAAALALHESVAKIETRTLHRLQLYEYPALLAQYIHLRA
jgi:hypothetical protein